MRYFDWRIPKLLDGFVHLAFASSKKIYDMIMAYIFLYHLWTIYLTLRIRFKSVISAGSLQLF